MPGYNGLYEVSNRGEVRSMFDSHDGLKSGRHLALNVQSTGYLTVTLCINRSKKLKYVHRLVLGAFVGTTANRQVCRHLDGNRKNNSLSNLKWGTYSENENDKVGHGRRINGERQWKAKLNEHDVIAMRGLYVSGSTIKEIGERFNVSKSAAFSAIKRQTWKHV